MKVSMGSQRLMVLSLLLLIAAPAYAASRILEGMNYTQHKGSPAIRINLGEGIEFRSHSPKKAAKIHTIRFRFRDRDLEDEFHPNESLMAPVSKKIPLTLMVFSQDGLGPRLVASFDQPVKLDVIMGPGSNAITLKLSGIPKKGKAETPKSKTKPEKTTSSDKLFQMGKKALKEGKPKRAIQLFTKLRGIKNHPKQRDALEMLGVARERNDQHAHAKSLYREYLHLYPEGESSDRVRQRLADLISHQVSPKKKLKAGKKSRGKNASFSRTFGSLSQYYYFAENDIPNIDNVEQSLLLTHLSYSWHVRNAGFDIRNFFYANHEHDFIRDVDDEMEINSMYSDIKHSQAGFYSKIGRQSSSSAGVLGRFDGLLLGYDMFKQSRLNLVAGYPVEYSDKDTVATHRPFWNSSIEFTDIVPNLDWSPYYVHQQVDGITDRQAAGYELRFFSPRKGNFFNMVDYDLNFTQLNIFLLRGQYHLSESNAINLNLDHRKSPLLHTSNATIGETENDTVEKLLQNLTEEEIMDLANDRTGEATAVTLGGAHNPGETLQINADVTHARQTFNTVSSVDGTLTEEEDSQDYYSLHMIFNRLLNHNDTFVLGLRYSDTSTYTNTLVSLAARIPFERTWRLDIRYRHDIRDSDNGAFLARKRPLIKVDYRPSRDMTIQLELSAEWWAYSGTSNNEDYQRTLANLGYRWNF